MIGVSLSEVIEMLVMEVARERTQESIKNTLSTKRDGQTRSLSNK